MKSSYWFFFFLLWIISLVCCLGTLHQAPDPGNILVLYISMLHIWIYDYYEVHLFIYFVYGSLIALPSFVERTFFSHKWLVYLYKKLTDYTHVGLFLGSLFCSTEKQSSWTFGGRSINFYADNASVYSFFTPLHLATMVLFFISVSKYLFLRYRSSVAFCMLTLYTVTFWINSFILQVCL